MYRSPSVLLKAISWPSDRSGANAIWSRVMPALYMSNLSGPFSCHSTGDRNAATGVGGARGVWDDMMYCSGGAYRGSSRY